MTEGEREKAEDREDRKSVRRRAIGLAALALAGLILLSVLTRDRPEETADDPIYEWRLRIPYTRLGGEFKAKQDDNLALVLRTQLPVDSPQWRTALDSKGEVEIGLSVVVKKAVPFRTRLRWLWGDRRWRRHVTYVTQNLPSVWVRKLPQPPAYEVRRGSSQDTVPVGEPLADCDEALRVALAEVERLIVGFQNGETVEGTSIMYPSLDHERDRMPR